MDRTNRQSTISITVTASDASLAAAAKQIAAKLQIAYQAPDAVYSLNVTPEGLSISKTQSRETTPLRIDFLHGKTAQRLLNQGKHLLARAVGFKKSQPLTVLDATAGLGQDGFVLASLGCQVLLLERSPIIAALLNDGIMRAKGQLPNLHMELQQINSIDYLMRLTPESFPDVIYLDPMYPEKQSSALNKKALRWLRDIVGDDNDAEQLLQVALSKALKRIVVKRPRLAPHLGYHKPDFSTLGKTCRFDVYLSQLQIKK